jgi:hypothetical protein
LAALNRRKRNDCIVKRHSVEEHDPLDKLHAWAPAAAARGEHRDAKNNHAGSDSAAGGGG